MKPYLSVRIEELICRNRRRRRRRRRRKKEEKLALFMKSFINFQQMIRCKEVLLRKDWRIITLLRVAGLQEDGPGSG